MFTGSLALLHRALRLDARLLQTHLFRVGFASLIYFSLIYAQAMSLTLGAPGLKLFESMSFLNLGLITLAGISFFATAISEEKEEETLGLLKMAGINPLGILLGKSTSRLMGAILLLLVQLPFTLLSITLGGVTLGQVIAAYCSLTAYLILLANVGLLTSVVSRRGSSASAMTVLFLMIYFLSPLFVTAVRTSLSYSGVIAANGAAYGLLSGLAHACEEASVATRLTAIMVTGFAENPMGLQVKSNLLLALTSFFIAWGSFNHFTRYLRSTTPESSATRWIRRGSLAARRRPKHSAIMWKEFHFTTGGWPALWARLACYSLVSLGILVGAERYYAYHLGQAALVVVFTMLGMLVFEASIYVSRIFHDEWRGHTLPLLMMLPISTARIAYSKVIGCLPALLPATVWVLLGTAILPNAGEEFLQTLYLPSRWMYVLITLLFLTLTAFFSMVVRWGALPLALAVMLLGGTFGGCCFAPVFGILLSASAESGGPEGAYFCVDIVIALLIAGLQFDIHRRLEIVAAQ